MKVVVFALLVLALATTSVLSSPLNDDLSSSDDLNNDLSSEFSDDSFDDENDNSVRGSKTEQIRSSGSVADATVSSEATSEDFYDDDEEFVGSTSEGGLKKKNKKNGKKNDNANKKNKKGKKAAKSDASNKNGVTGSVSSSTDGDNVVVAGKPVPIPIRSLGSIIADGDGNVLGLFPVEITFDILAGLLLVAFGFAYFIGKGKNRALAEACLEKLKPFFESQFCSVGIIDADAPAPEEGKAVVTAPLLCESPSEFKFYATGRVHCQSCLGTINLAPRQDLFSLVLDLFFPNPDTLTLEIPLHPHELDTFTVAVFPEARRDPIKEEHPDLADGCIDATSAAASIPHAADALSAAGLSVLADCPEAVPELFKPQIVSVLAAHGKALKLLHVTDRYAGSVSAGSEEDEGQQPRPQVRHRAMLRAVIALRDPTAAGELTRAVVGLADIAAKIAIRGTAKAKVVKIRNAANLAREKEMLRRKADETAQKLAEQKHKEKQAKVDELKNMSPEALIKYEEKERARMAKKKMQSRMKVVKG